MKYLKSFKVFEEIDIDVATDNKMRDTSLKIVEVAKKYEQLLFKSGVKIISKNIESDDESANLRQEAIKRIKEGDEFAYGIMKWSGDICQSFQIISPVRGFEVIVC